MKKLLFIALLFIPSLVLADNSKRIAELEKQAKEIEQKAQAATQQYQQFMEGAKQDYAKTMGAIEELKRQDSPKK